MYYAIQIAPENMDWAFEYDITNDEYAANDFAIYGNREYHGYKPERIEKLIDLYERDIIEQALFDPQGKDGYNIYDEWKNSTEAMNDICPKDNGKSWSSREVKAMRDSIQNISNRCGSYHNHEDVMADLLTVITGHKWKRRQISGSCQSEWNELIYDTERIPNEYAKIISRAYFNECTQWMIIDDELPDDASVEDVEEAYGISGFCGFAYEWSDDGIRKEVADMLGVSAEQVTLYAHDGYTHIAKYRKVA